MHRALLVAVVAAVAACKVNRDVGNYPADGASAGGGPGGNGGPGGAGGASGGGGAANPCDPQSLEMAGCTCTTPGETRGCWPGPPEKDGVGACKRGAQVCEGQTVLRWGACNGAVLPGEENCGDGVDNDCDGKTDCEDPKCAGYCAGPEVSDRPIEPPPREAPDAPVDRASSEPPPDLLGAESPPSCTCIPGAKRWCDSVEACSLGQQVCMSNGEWGICHETGSTDLGCPVNSGYFVCCCLKNGGCCEASGLGGAGPSAGACGGVTCGGGRNSTSLSAGCPGAGLCVPGTTRWCGTPGDYSWGKQTCTTEDKWGDCTATPDRPGKCAAAQYVVSCCAWAGECCQADPYDVDCKDTFSVGNCAGIACK